MIVRMGLAWVVASATLVAWGCSNRDEAHSVAGVAGEKGMGEGGMSAGGAAAEAGAAGDRAGVGGAAGDRGMLIDSCVPRPLTEICTKASSACPADIQQILDSGRCTRSEISSQKLSCGGELVVAGNEWFTERWAFDAGGKLTYRSIETDEARQCSDGTSTSLTEYGEPPCITAAAAQVLCGAGGEGGGGA